MNSPLTRLYIIFYYFLLGKLVLDPAKNAPSKAELTQKIGQMLSKDPLPPIKNNNSKNDKDKSAKISKNGQAFTVVFDENSEKMKMKKYSKFQGIPKREAHSKIDDRYVPLV